MGANEVAGDKKRERNDILKYVEHLFEKRNENHAAVKIMGKELLKYEEGTEKNSEIKNKIRMIQLEIEQFETAISALKEFEQLIVRLKYEKGMTWKRIAIETTYSEAQCKRIGYAAIVKIYSILDYCE